MVARTTPVFFPATFQISCFVVQKTRRKKKQLCKLKRIKVFISVTFYITQHQSSAHHLSAHLSLPVIKTFFNSSFCSFMFFFPDGDQQFLQLFMFGAASPDWSISVREKI